MPLFGNIFDFSKENKQKEDDKKWFLQPKVIPPFIYCFTFMNKAGQQYHKGNTTNLLQHLEHNYMTEKKPQF